MELNKVILSKDTQTQKEKCGMHSDIRWSTGNLVGLVYVLRTVRPWTERAGLRLGPSGLHGNSVEGGNSGGHGDTKDANDVGNVGAGSDDDTNDDDSDDGDDGMCMCLPLYVCVLMYIILDIYT